MTTARYVCATIIFLAILKEFNATSLNSNATISIDRNSRALLESVDLSELKERYRRLIPYMTYFVIQNQVRQPLPQHLQQYVRANSEGTVVRRPQYTQLRANQDQHYHERFVPSVQYNPKNMNSESDYFVPIRYNPKTNYDYASNQYRVHKPHVYTDTVPAVTVSTNRFNTTPRPLRPLKRVPERNLLPNKQNPPRVKIEEDYAYIDQPETFESVRFVSRGTIRPQQYVRIAKPAIESPLLSNRHNIPPANLDHIVKSLHLSNQLPEVLNKENLDSSIKTLAEILNILNNGKKENYAPSQLPDYHNPENVGPKFHNFRPQINPKVITESNYEATQGFVNPHNEHIAINPVQQYVEKTTEKHVLHRFNDSMLQNEKTVQYYVPIIQDIDVDQKPFKQPAQPQTIRHKSKPVIKLTYDEGLESERYPLPISNVQAQSYKISEVTHPNVHAAKTGVSRGKAHVDYPAYAAIPETNFNCKQQRYKGFFGDPATRCQVWHYCDLNGGKASFLCPNGTIFSQSALTCDWWFNVKCEATTQLYVLNERLYKYILPIMPKFPEDFSGPEVDKYLELKFKEMEEKLKEKKLKKEQEEKEKISNKLQALEEQK